MAEVAKKKSFIKKGSDKAMKALDSAVNKDIKKPRSGEEIRNIMYGKGKRSDG